MFAPTPDRGEPARGFTHQPGDVVTIASPPLGTRMTTSKAGADIVAAQCLDGRMQPADVAALALFLASDDARMCTGHDYRVDAGWR